MKVVCAIALQHLKRVFRERASLFWIFVGPLLFVGFFGMVFREPPPRKTAVDLWNRDTDDRVARALAVALGQDDLEVRSVPRPAEKRYTLEVPPGSAQALAAGKGVALVLHSPETEQTNAERRVSFRATKALMSVYLQANPGDLKAAATDAEISARLSSEKAIRVERAESGVEARTITMGFQRSLPAYLVMFLFMNLLISGASLAEDRAGGQLRRIFMAPISRAEIVGGLLLSRVAIGWIQAGYMLVMGVVLFKIRWAAHPWWLFGFLTLFAVCAASLGMVIATLFRDPDKCEATAVWTSILLAPLGGLWWPLEVVPPFMRQLGHLVPTGWAMESLNAMLAFGDGPLEIAPQAGALVALTAAALFLVSRRLKPS